MNSKQPKLRFQRKTHVINKIFFFFFLPTFKSKNFKSETILVYFNLLDLHSEDDIFNLA